MVAENPDRSRVNDLDIQYQKEEAIGNKYPIWQVLARPKLKKVTLVLFIPDQIPQIFEWIRD